MAMLTAHRAFEIVLYALRRYLPVSAVVLVVETPVAGLARSLLQYFLREKNRHSVPRSGAESRFYLRGGRHRRTAH